MSTLRLRPHHILCLQTFRGSGYSPDFVAGMKKIVAELEENAETSLQIVNICDDICHLCSNRNGWSCTSLRPSIFDVLVSGRYNILPGKEYTWKTLLSMLPPLSLELLEECCPNCQWLSLCRQIVSEEPHQRPHGQQDEGRDQDDRSCFQESLCPSVLCAARTASMVLRGRYRALS